MTCALRVPGPLLDRRHEGVEACDWEGQGFACLRSHVATVYALGAHLNLPAMFSGPDALKAMQGHVLARGQVTGLYALNPEVMKKIGMK